jgi:ApbE superfamily uncharacterized protein (UPF0280 family)
MYKLMPFFARWSNAAPATCCGVCRSCATATAGNLAAVAGAVALEAVGLRREENATTPVELPMAGPAQPRSASSPK